MRMLLAFTSLIAVACAVGSGPKDSGASRPPFETGDHARRLAEVNERIDDALARRDRSALEAMVAAPFTWIHASDARTDSREVWLANAAAGTALSGQRTNRSEHGVTVEFHGTSANGEPHTAVRSARVRLRDAAGTREMWMRQSRVFVRGGDGAWRLAWGQGTLMYEGPPLDAALHARYAGTYAIREGRTLVLSWEDEGLFATLPTGAKAQIFLASPTEEAARTAGAGHLRFTLGPDGAPVTASLIRNGQEVWRATRVSSPPSQ